MVPYEIVYVNTPLEAKTYVDQGYEPIGFPSISGYVSSKVTKDNPGFLGNLADIACFYFWVHIDKYVVTGLPKAEFCFAILAFSGAINRDRKIASVTKMKSQETSSVDLLHYPYNRKALFEMNGSNQASYDGWLIALEAGTKAFGTPKLTLDDRLALFIFEWRRKIHAKSTIVEKTNSIAFVLSDSPEFHYWHQFSTIVVQYRPGAKSVTLSGSRSIDFRSNKKSLLDLTQNNGMEKLYPILDKELGVQGSTGSWYLGSSPNGTLVTFDQAKAIFEAIKSEIT